MNASEILSVTQHRPYPVPSGPWVMRQSWHDLLFAHWALEPEHVRAAMPEELRPYLDTYDGKAWVGVIPFWMSNVRMRGIPPIPTAATFPELNVRTYVTISGKPGVYFFSLDAASLLAVMGARAGGLNYFHAAMRCVLEADKVKYASRRTQRPKPAEFQGEYAAVGPAALSAPGSLEHFVVERYCLYAVRGGRISRVNIHHHPWPLQRAEARIEKNTMASASGISLPGSEPVLHFAKRMDVLIWWLEPA
jgi:uncharacterized protein